MLMGIMWMMTALVVGFMAGRISMYGLWDTDEGETEEGRDSRQAESGKQGRRRRDRSQEDGRPSWSLASPVTGEVLLQKEGEHPTMVIHPHSDRLYAPADGKVSRLYPMGSAFLFTTEFGAEIYIQAGCGEDDLLARFYRPRVLQNEVVEKGKLLLEFDRRGLEEEGVSVEVSVCVEHFCYGGEVRMTAGDRVAAGEEILQILEPSGQAVTVHGFAVHGS